MDPQQNRHFISLIHDMGASSRPSQPPPLPPGLGTSLSPMMIPLATSEAAAAMSFSQPPQPTITMIQTAPPAARPAQVMLSQSLATPHDVIAVSTPVPVQPQVPLVHLYKCSTGGSSSDTVTHEVSERSKEKASLDQLQKAYTDLNSRKIKDALSSFLPDIPGEFDSSEPPGTMLLDLVEHKPIGGKEFHPLSGQALLGFRLLPGPLPEQFRIDPPSTASQAKSRKKKKHKRRNIDRSEEKGDIYHSAPKPSKPPSDAYSFIKPEPHYMMQGSETVLHSGGGGGVVGGATGVGLVTGGAGVVGGGGVSAGQILQQQGIYGAPGTAHLVTQVLGDKKKKKKRDKDDQKKKKKEKKKRKHHPPQDPTGHPVHPPLPHSHVTPPPPSSTSTPHFPHPHT